MPMMGYGGFGFGMIFLIVYLGVIVYFFMLLTKISRSLERIADKIEYFTKRNE